MFAPLIDLGTQGRATIGQWRRRSTDQSSRDAETNFPQKTFEHIIVWDYIYDDIMMF